MADLLQILQSQLDGNAIQQLTKRIGAENDDQTAVAVNSVIGTMVNALAKNASTPQGAQSLFGAVSKGHDGSILDNVMGLFGSNDANPMNGLGILSHVLGGNISSVINMVSQMSGLDKSKSGNLLLTLAPVVLGALGKAKAQSNVQQPQGLLDMLMSGAQTANKRVVQHQPSNTSIFSRILDQDGDGSVMDDIAGMGAKHLLKGLFK